MMFRCLTCMLFLCFWLFYSAESHAANPENDYWKDQAALLDPSAYKYVSGEHFNITKDSSLYLINGWQLTWEGDTSKFWYHRKADISDALLIPAGVALQHIGSPIQYGFEYGYAYYADPLLVIEDERYKNAKSLYYERLKKLKSLELHSLKVNIQQGQTVSQAASQNNLVSEFPKDFENGLIVHFSNMDGSWMLLETPQASPARVLNLENELDDIRPVRFTGTVLLPFKRSTFSHLRIGFGSMFWQQCKNVNTPEAGCIGPDHPINPIYPKTQTYPAYGQILYYKLPSDW